MAPLSKPCCPLAAANKKALAELEIRLMAVGLLQKVQLQLVPDQDSALQLVPSPTPRSGLMVTASGR